VATRQVTPPISAPALLLPRDIDHVRLLGRWVVLAVVVGAVSGCLVHALRETLLLLASLRSLSPGAIIFVLPILGGFINGFAIFRVDREARGEGIYTYIKTSGDRESRLGIRFVVLKVLATLATLGSGARGGLVGPFVAIHAALGLVLCRCLPFLRRFVWDQESGLQLSGVCGAAGAVGALFLSPLGGGIFAVEILFGGSLSYAALFPAILTSTAAFLVSGLLRGQVRLGWIHPDWAAGISAATIAITLVTAVAAGFVGILFVYANKRLPYFLERRHIPLRWRPVIGAVLCATAAVVFGREVLFTGVDLFGRGIPDLLRTTVAYEIGSLARLLVGIGLAVTFTVGSSGSGGLTMPAMTLGVLSGAVVASIFAVDPAQSLPFLIAGMTACLASSLNVPIAAAVISLEIFGAGMAYAAVLGSVIGYQIGRGHLMYRYLKA